MVYKITIQSLQPGARLARFVRRYHADSINEARGIAVNDLQLVDWYEGSDYHIASIQQTKS